MPSVDFSGDPILAQIQALALQNNAAAEASATAQRQKALIAFGYDPALQSLYGDQNTSSAAQQNPFSTLANLGRQHTQRQTALNQNLNQHNLFYSSYRGQQLQNEGTQYLGEQAAAQQALQGQLDAIQNNLLSERQNSQQQVSQAYQDAYSRALQTALANGGVGAITPKRYTTTQRIRRYTHRRV
jgi:hypothetical protein